jgi:glucose-6-phosphate 1-dehydrogenase
MQIKLNDKSINDEAPIIHPTIFIIFGITGDLASRKLLPALLALYTKKLLPPRFSVIGFSRRAFSREEFREFIRSRLNIKHGQFREEEIKHFFDHITYEQGNFDDLKSYTNLAERLKSVDERWGECSNKLFHLSVPPTLYETILSKIHDSGLSLPCSDFVGWTRILIEKPFGNDIETAKKLDDLLGKLFKEEQIFRIDHYLAKESLQNILAFRFTNSIFETLWSREHIEKIHIKLFEKNTMDGRGAFYDPIGALKDVGQNHILQMLALVAMDKPKSFISREVRKERAKILASLKPLTKKTLDECVVKGQYSGYLNEKGVSTDSVTETFFRIKANIDSLRWRGVSFYLESGKAMFESKTEIDIYFKPDKNQEDQQNILTFRIQPDEGIKIRFMIKTPGYGFEVEPKILKFKYAESVNLTSKPDDYERLIFDSIIGDQTLFASTEEIMASWHFVTSLIKAWKDLPLLKYDKGTKEVY